MVDGIERLKEIGLDKVSKSTHIELEHIKWIVDKNFSKLAKYNVKGLIKVIQRECSVDLQDWLDEFAQFKLEHPEEKCPEILSTPKIIDSYDLDEPQKGGGKFIIFILALLGVLFFIWYFEIYKHFDSFFGYLNDKNRSVTYSDVTIVENAEQKLKSNGIEIQNNSNLAKVLSEPKIDEIDENNTQYEILNSDLNASDENITTELKAPNIAEDSESIDENVTEAPKNIINDNDIKIIPKTKIWIGVIDLNTHKKTSIMTSNKFDINSSKEQLILTGHGQLKLQDNDKIQDLNSQYPYRFLVKNGKISEIDAKEFMRLNNGKAW